MNVIISACLLGIPCRYNGGSYSGGALEKLLTDRRLHLVPVCPEQLGGLATPRPPSERVGEQVLAKTGEDVTEAFRLGADCTLKLAASLDCRCALLKARSPSCGSGVIYDGTFTGTRIPGDGVAAEALRRSGLPMFDEEHLAEFWAFVERECME